MMGDGRVRDGVEEKGKMRVEKARFCYFEVPACLAAGSTCSCIVEGTKPNVIIAATALERLAEAMIPVLTDNRPRFGTVPLGGFYMVDSCLG